MNHHILVLLFTAAVAVFSSRASETALDRYVHTPDPAYEYHLVNTITQDGAKVHVIEMTSQRWLTTNEVDRVLWKHWMIVTQPPEVKSRKSLLFIGGGNNKSGAPTKADANMVKMALASKTIVTELKMVPNQTLVFSGDTMQRDEDEIIAYTWAHFLRTGDERWPLRLPMTKSAVRAMDTVQDFLAKLPSNPITIDGFVVAGGSKRGWTTWATAAVDKRVVGIVPIVIDMLNIKPSFIHHYEAYGFWAPAVGDYVAERLMDRYDTPAYQALMKIEEPFEYRERLTMPKFILNACGDQFFLPDSSQFYFHELPGAKSLRYVPNTDHSMRESDAYETLLAAYVSVVTGIPVPTLEWRLNGNGSYVVTSSAKPKSVKVWQAHNDKARDFRMENIGKAWTSTELNIGTDLRWAGTVKTPQQGWTAFMVEYTFDGPVQFKTTTDVQVVPDTLPFKGKTPRADPNSTF